MLLLYRSFPTAPTLLADGPREPVGTGALEPAAVRDRRAGTSVLTRIHRARVRVPARRLAGG